MRSDVEKPVQDRRCPATVRTSFDVSSQIARYSSSIGTGTSEEKEQSIVCSTRKALLFCFYTNFLIS
jgi:hypothetical protein